MINVVVKIKHGVRVIGKDASPKKATFSRKTRPGWRQAILREEGLLGWSSVSQSPIECFRQGEAVNWVGSVERLNMINMEKLPSKLAKRSPKYRCHWQADKEEKSLAICVEEQLVCVCVCVCVSGWVSGLDKENPECFWWEAFWEGWWGDVKK